MKRLVFLFATLVVLTGQLILMARPTAAAVTTYFVRLTGDQEVPPVTNDPAGGTATLVFDGTIKDLIWTLSISGVTPLLVAGAELRRGATGTNGPLLYSLKASSGPNFSGRIPLADSDASDLLAGNIYLNLLTVAHPEGAARSQIVAPIARIHQQQIDALNAGDLTTTMSFFADDAQITVGGCAQSPCTGKAAIQTEVSNQIANHAHVTILNPRASGNVLTETEDIAFDQFRAFGIDRVRFTFTTVFAGDKVISASGVPDQTDPETRAFLAAATQGGISPPSTGDAGLLTGDNATTE